MAKQSFRQLQEGQHYKLVDNAGCTISYSCSFTWKIDQVQQRRMSTLYSQPFHIVQNGPGYKMCLILFMDGDGSGQGTRVYYAALMKGEHDTQLQWPFRQKMTLVLMSQDQQQKQDIIKCPLWFQPNPILMAHSGSLLHIVIWMLHLAVPSLPPSLSWMIQLMWRMIPWFLSV